MLQPNVILIGASVRSFSQSALRDGIRPVCVDMFCDSDLRMCLREYGLREAFWCRQIDSFANAASAVADVDPDVPVIALGGLENHESGFRQLLAQRTVLGPDWDTIEQLRNPRHLFPTLRKRGCSIPGFVVKGQSLPRPGPGMRWLRKNRHSAGGQGIRWYMGSDESRRQQSDTVLTDDLQEFIDGIPISASFFAAARSDNESTIVRRDTVLLGCALQLSGCDALHAADFHFCGNAGPLILSASLTQQVVDAGRAIVDEWPVDGLFGIDFVVRDGHPFVVEVNPRPTASQELHELARPDLPGHVFLQLGRSAQQFLSAADGSDRNTATGGPGHRNDPPGCWARFVIYADQDTVITDSMEVKMLTHCTRNRSGTSKCAWLADIPCSETTILTGTPLCSLYVDLAAKDLCFSRLSALLHLLPLATSPPINGLVETIQAQFVVLAND
jgi:predicted ATP-grasp superfamily ATP-dependent carboligase